MDDDKELVITRVHTVPDPEGEGPPVIDTRWVLADMDSSAAAIRILAEGAKDVIPPADMYIGINTGESRSFTKEFADAVTSLRGQRNGAERRPLIGEVHMGEPDIEDEKGVKADQSIPGFEQGMRFHARLMEELAELLDRRVRVIVVADKIQTGSKAIAAINFLKKLDADIIGLAVIACNPLGGEDLIFDAGVPNVIAAIRYKPGALGASELEVDRSAPVVKTVRLGGDGSDFAGDINMQGVNEGQPATIVIRSADGPRKTRLYGLAPQVV